MPSHGAARSKTNAELLRDVRPCGAAGSGAVIGVQGVVRTRLQRMQIETSPARLASSATQDPRRDPPRT